MKRYIVFSGFDYYPSGGASDYLSSHDNLEEAVVAGMKTLIGPLPNSWWQVFDCEEQKIVREST